MNSKVVNLFAHVLTSGFCKGVCRRGMMLLPLSYYISKIVGEML